MILLFNTKVLKSGDWMKKGFNKILILEIILLIFLLFNSFVFKIANMYVISGIMLPFLILMIVLNGFEKDNYRYKKDVLLNIIIFLLMYYFITYFLGLFSGFVKSSYSLSFINIIKNTFPVIVLILISELMRYVLFNKTKRNLPCLIIGCLLFVMVDVNTMVHIYDVKTALGITKMICLVVFPSITKNIFLTYLTMKVGYKNGIIYRLITEISTYLLPIFPDFGEYINVLLKTVLPIAIMARLNNMFNYYSVRKIKDSRYNSRKLVLYSFITFALLTIVLLTSGLFTYQALTIGSGSMSPAIEKGDVIILKSMKNEEARKIKKGDVLVYNHDNKIIVHRVIKKSNNGETISFKTKGDYNNAKDSWIVKQEDVIGIVKFRIRWVGMPTVALNELLNK
ncbi:peptidase S26B signal peptidase [Clostridium sp. CAG:594]|nr:peptidase S26B signal peptidase [Clostridium sp. CAG:594]